ncbi:hypothetical protein Ciccas_004696 [Cichlidogyrus casuarinus]|uniref:UDENN domain-containing protein n=1 Tax=Cichlidogyrus casuarinus TaxID=1844966 RepID=A0ABD2QB68_9PLAT
MACIIITMPLNWCHSIFTVLPDSTLEFLECPTPYIAGIHRSMVEIAKPLLPSNVILLDLDEKKLFSSEMVQESLFPESFIGWAHSILKTKKEYSKSDMEKQITRACVGQPIMRIVAAILYSYQLAFTLNGSEYTFNTSTFVNRFPKMTRFNRAFARTSMLQDVSKPRNSLLLHAELVTVTGLD